MDESKAEAVLNDIGAAVMELANSIAAEPEKPLDHFARSRDFNKLVFRAAAAELPRPPIPTDSQTPGQYLRVLTLWLDEAAGALQRRQAAPKDHQAESAGGDDAPPKPPQHKRRMTVTEANDMGKQLAKQLGKVFFLLSENEQARKIGCSWGTWSKTELYVTHHKKDCKTTPGTRRPKAVSFTPAMEAVTGEGDRDATLNELIAQQEADREPSPLEGGSKKVYRPKKRL